MATGTKPFSAFEWMISLRYLGTRRKEGFISVIAGFSFLGILLGPRRFGQRGYARRMPSTPPACMRSRRPANAGAPSPRHSTCSPMGACSEPMKDDGVKGDERRRRQRDRGLDQPAIDTRRQEVAKEIGVAPIACGCQEEGASQPGR